MERMPSSPFHGIFGSLHQEDNTSLNIAKSFWRKDQPSSQPQKSKQVGQVAVDIYEQDDSYIIKAPIAGVRLSDIDIEVNDNVVSIRGQRKQTDAIPEEQYSIQECYWGEFKRSITLPCSIDPRKIRATFNRECILKIIIPKEERVRIVRITEG